MEEKKNCCAGEEVSEKKVCHCHEDEKECSCGNACHCHEEGDHCNCESEEVDEKVEGYTADGIGNLEHALDVFGEIKICYENIEDNTDLAFEILKTAKEEGDEDVVDALAIYCSNVLDEEKLAKEVFENSCVLIENMKLDRAENLDKKEKMLREYLSALVLHESKSEASLEKIIKNSK